MRRLVAICLPALGIIGPAACSKSPAAPSISTTTGFVLHVIPSPACAGLWPADLPQDIWSARLIIVRREGELVRAVMMTAARGEPGLWAELAITGATVSGLIGGSRWMPGTAFQMNLTQTGSRGYGAQVSGTRQVTGLIAGSLSGSISIFSDGWISCDIADHRFTLTMQ